MSFQKEAAHGNGDSYGSDSNASAQHKVCPAQDTPSPDAKAVRRPGIAQTIDRVNSFIGGSKLPQAFLDIQQTVKEPATHSLWTKSDRIVSLTPSTRQQTALNLQTAQGRSNQRRTIQISQTPQNDTCKQPHNPTPAISESRDKILRQKQNIQNASQHRTAVHKIAVQSQQASGFNATKRKLVKVPQTSKTGAIRQRAGDSPPNSSGGRPQQKPNVNTGEDSRGPFFDRDIRQSSSNSPQIESSDAVRQDQLLKGLESTVKVQFSTCLHCKFHIPNQHYPLAALIPNIAALYNERQVNDHHPQMEAKDLPFFFHQVFYRSKLDLRNRNTWTVCNCLRFMGYSDDYGRFFFSEKLYREY
jgi:hypothetical protein